LRPDASERRVIGEEVLLTTAEVGVAFAGFASVVTVFQRREDGAWTEADVVRFRLMIATSLSVVLLALLPFAIAFFGAGEEAVWAVCSALLAAHLVLFLALVAGRSLRLASAGALSRLVAWGFLGGAAITLALQVCNVVGFVFAREVGPFFVGLLYLLVLSGISFARLLPVGRGGTG
jgi:hypothetical protein